MRTFLKKKKRFLQVQKGLAVCVSFQLSAERELNLGQCHPPMLWSGTQLFFFSPSANLSDLYFTNRQDRYVLLQDSPEIADFFTELVDAIGDVSLQLQRDDTVQMMEGMEHPYQGRRELCYLSGCYHPEDLNSIHL